MKTDNSHTNGSVELNCRNCTNYYNCEEKLGKDFNPWGYCSNYIYDM